MRSRHVKKGFNLLTVGIVMVALAAFFPVEVSRLIPFSGGPGSVLFLGFFWGSLFAGAGGVVTLFGLILREEPGGRVPLRAAFLFLSAVICIFAFLFFNSLRQTGVDHRPLRPGETITI